MVSVAPEIQGKVVDGSFSLLTVVIVLAGIGAAVVPIVTALVAPFIVP